MAILSEGLWKDLFAKSPDVLGKDIRLSGVPYRIIGVMPDEFRPPGSEIRVWVPFAFRPDQTTDDARHSNNWDMIGAAEARGDACAYAQQRIDAINKENLERLPKYRELLISARFCTRVSGLEGRIDARHPPDALHPAGGGCVRAPHRLREPRQPDAGPVERAHEGTGDPLQPGRRPLAAGEAVADRERHAVPRRRAAWASLVGLAACDCCPSLGAQ